MKDWTINPETNRSNSSAEFEFLKLEVARLIQDSAHTLISGGVHTVAGLIIAQLAHNHNMIPYHIAKTQILSELENEQDLA